MTRKSAQNVLFSVVLLLTASSAAYSQGVTGRIQGTVHDPSNAVVAGAPVTVANQATGYKVTVPTNQSGEFLASNLPPVSRPPRR